jgi:hypothetical protein
MLTRAAEKLHLALDREEKYAVLNMFLLLIQFILKIDPSYRKLIGRTTQKLGASNDFSSVLCDSILTQYLTHSQLK